MSYLTLGSNQRLEFLGDTVLQLVTSDYLYKHFPEHHEGHLSLLRSSLVNNRTQAVVADDLGMPAYSAYSNPKHELKTKDRADILEAFLGALYVDKDLEFCRKFSEVCFFPRLHQFILNQEWNDPKSKLQQCCLTLRTMDGREPDIPVYKVTESKGPTNTRVYCVVVYFRGKRLAREQGHSIQEAEMNAASAALKNCSDLFPHLSYQKKIVERSFHVQDMERKKQEWRDEVVMMRKKLGLDEPKIKEEPKDDSSPQEEDRYSTREHESRRAPEASHRQARSSTRERDPRRDEDPSARWNRDSRRDGGNYSRNQSLSREREAYPNRESARRDPPAAAAATTAATTASPGPSRQPHPSPRAASSTSNTFGLVTSLGGPSIQVRSAEPPPPRPQPPKERTKKLLKPAEIKREPTEDLEEGECTSDEEGNGEDPPQDQELVQVKSEALASLAAYENISSPE